MVRYKRYRRYGGRRSTNVIKMKFQSFMDISTSDSSMQIITISAGGPEILRRLAPQFGAYKYYKVGNIACKLVPASTLPVDPTGLSYEAGENTVDPRDQLTPGMMRITNGEDVFENIAGTTSEAMHALYNNMLLDPRWYKWMLQTGVKRHAIPRYWQIGQLHQDQWPGMYVNYPAFNSNGLIIGTAKRDTTLIGTTEGITSAGTHDEFGSSDKGIFQVGHRGTIGWLPTDGLQIVEASNDILVPHIASPPEIEVMKIILPQAYKTKFYYRMFITETVYFKDPIVNFGIDAGSGISFRPLDVFHIPGTPSPKKPLDVVVDDFPMDSQTGGNYGDD